MKKMAIALLILSMFSGVALAQGETDCFLKWAVLFEKRGLHSLFSDFWTARYIIEKSTTLSLRTPCHIAQLGFIT